MLVVKYLEPWAKTHQQRWHAEALQVYGEKVIVRHRWNVRDYAQGRVTRCITCSASTKLNEQQRIRVTEASGGTFTLTFAGLETSNLLYDASATEVKTALEELDVNDVGDVAVSGDSISDLGLVIEFMGQWANTETIPNMTSSSNLNGPGANIEVLEIQSGAGGLNVEKRFADVYKQAGDSWCQDCYGIGFQGGYEPIIYVTWAMIKDGQNETTRSVGGAIQREEPDAQFSFEPIVEEFDLMARVEAWELDNITPRSIHGRYVIGEVKPQTLRTGPGTPDETIATMPEQFRTPFQIPDRDWVIGQRAPVVMLPLDDPQNLVPLTRAEERVVEMGAVPERRWHQSGEADSPFDARGTYPA